MTDRPSVLQKLALFPEVTPMTTGTPTRLLRGMDVTISPQAEVSEIRATGYKPITMTALNREWTELSGDVEPDYNEAIYLYGSAFNSPGTATVAGTAAAATAFTWAFNPNSASLDTLKSYTIEHGDANHAVRVPGVQVTGMSMDIGRDDVAMAFDAIGGRMTPVTLGTAAAFLYPGQAPILPGQINLYLDPTFATLGTTKLTRDMHVSWSVSDRVGPIWPIDSANESFAALIELESAWEVTLTMGADGGTAGMGGTALYNTLRGGSTVYLRQQAIGGLIAGTHAYTWTHDYALQVVSAPSAEDMDGLYVWAWTLRPVHDSSMGSFTQVTVKNAVGVY